MDLFKNDRFNHEVTRCKAMMANLIHKLPLLKLNPMFICILLITFLILPAMADQSDQSVPFKGDRNITVMSRNLYFGTDLNPIIAATSRPEIIAAVTSRFAEVQATDFTVRAQALADEIEEKQPDLIGLQEAVLWRSQFPPDFNSTPNAETIEYDFVQLLIDALETRGLHYAPVAISTGFDAELPALLPTGNCCREIRLTDREVILARTDSKTADLKLSNIQERNFVTNLGIPILGSQITALRGWASIDVKVRGKSFRFITTHLEPFYQPVRVAQANELLNGPANTTLPVILVCDCNSNAVGIGDAYNSLIAAGFMDAWSQANPEDSGFTCCQDEDLLNPFSKLSERIDFVLYHGDFKTNNVEVFGEDPDNRISSPSGFLWPSDHAGIAATLQFRNFIDH